MLAFIQFAAPALLVGVAAATLPIVIHFLLRPRPRQVRFPAVAFLHPALASGQRAQRLRNFWLLLLRTLLLACAAVVLAGPTCTPTQVGPELEGPVAGVLVVDDSWSMQYRVAGEATLFDRARTEALELIRSSGDWPQVSTLALVWADATRPVVELTPDRGAIRASLRAVATPARHAGSLHHALREAARLLQAAPQPNRRLIVFTDQAAHAWRDVAPGLLTGIDNLRVTVCSVAPPRRTNIAITACRGPAGLHPESLPVPLDVTLSATGLDATCALVLRDEGRVVERSGPFEVPADSVHDLTLMLPPRPPGVQALTLTVEPDDRLHFDQTRYVAFQTAQRPVAWLVTPPDAGPDTDLTALLVRNLLAPERLEAQRQLVTFRQISPAELDDRVAGEPDAGGRARGAGGADLLVIMGGVELNEAARQGVRRQVERGATVLLLPGSGGGGADWPGLRRLLSRSVLRVDTLDSVTNFSWETGSTFSGKSAALDELTRSAIRRRVVLAGLEEGVVVEARYADGPPAIVALRRGRGRLVLLTTSPDPQWSELGVRAGGLLTWLHELLQEALGSPDAAATFTAGQTTHYSFGGLPDRGVARVFSTTDAGGKPISVWLSNGEPTQGWPTQQPGIYAIRLSRKDAREMLYAVNWPPEESDLRAVTTDRLAALLGVPEVAIEGGETVEEETRSSRFARLTGLRDGARLLPLVLLGLVLGELLLAGRVRQVRRQE